MALWRPGQAHCWLLSYVSRSVFHFRIKFIDTASSTTGGGRRTVTRPGALWTNKILLKSKKKYNKNVTKIKPRDADKYKCNKNYGLKGRTV